MDKYVLVLLMALALTGCTDKTGAKPLNAGVEPVVAGELPKAGQNVTFVEIGSLICIPCRQMQPVMQAVEKRYGPQLRVIFYDVNNPEQRYDAEKYRIRVIPTQVFLDSTGKEFYRHEGFLSQEQIDLLMKQRGLVPLTGQQR